MVGGGVFAKQGISLAEEEKEGTPWTDDELDLIVADYFAMLQAERLGQTYVKAQHNRALREKIGRSRSSVEFKYRNISAVLVKLAIDGIAGYRPAFHFQDALVDAVDRYVSVHGALMEPAPPAYRHGPVGTIFVSPPVRGLSEGGRPVSGNWFRNSTRSKEIVVTGRSAEPVRSSSLMLSGVA